MEMRPLGQSGLQVSSMCLGTMSWGEQNTTAEAHEQLDYCFEKGLNFIDTAEMYPVSRNAVARRSGVFPGNYGIDYIEPIILSATNGNLKEERLCGGDWKEPVRRSVHKVGNVANKSIKAIILTYVSHHEPPASFKKPPLFVFNIGDV